MNRRAMWVYVSVILLALTSCQGKTKGRRTADVVPQAIDSLAIEYREIRQDIYVRDYFKWMSAALDSINASRGDSLDEYVLVHANPWIIDSLRHTDYYHLKELGIVSKDPTGIKLLEKGTMLYVPDPVHAEVIRTDLQNTWLDINIPEFTLRVMRHDSAILTFPVRVGRNDSRYLAMAGRVVDMRTQTGEGKIVRINRHPVFINPLDNKPYKVTRRDDGIVTQLPNIPWLEPEIDGIRYGQLFHPTTNLETLGKAYSNGCIALRESDAWSLYFFAPMGTKVVIRYDLKVTSEDGSIRELPNIYPGFESRTLRRKAARAAAKAIAGLGSPVCCWFFSFTRSS